MSPLPTRAILDGAPHGVRAGSEPYKTQWSVRPAAPTIRRPTDSVAPCGTALEQTCPECSHPNPADHRFCGCCGAKLETFAEPAERPEPAHRTTATPKYLAEKILQSKSALEGERKRVTVLFADVKGSMELAETLDPEEWSAIMQRFFTILADGVERFEGFVDKFTGDGIMALFGAPIAHEDHARRACYAALHLRDELREFGNEVKRCSGVDFAVRIGVNSGDVVVGSIGDDLRMEYTAQGHTVGLRAAHGVAGGGR